MKKTICFIFSILLIFICQNTSFSQGKMYLTFESGVGFLKPMDRYEKLHINSNSEYFCKILRKNYDTINFHFRMSLDTRIHTSKIYNLYFMTGFVYFEKNIAFRDSGYCSACVYIDKILDLVMTKNHKLGFSTGLMIRTHFNKFTISSSLLLNPIFRFYSETNKYSFIDSKNQYNKSNLLDPELFLSGQFSLQYMLEGKFLIGPSIEIFTTNLLENHNIENPTKYISINPGIKLSFLIN